MNHKGTSSTIKDSGNFAWISVCVIVLLTGLIVVISSLNTAEANGRGFEIFRSVEGPYEIVVAVQPKEPVVGVVHFTITPFNTRTLAVVPDARIEILARMPDGESTYRTLAVKPSQNGVYYDANLTFRKSGEWNLTIKMTSGKLGEAKVEFPFTVGNRPIAQTWIGTLIWFFVVVTLLSGGVYLWLNSRRVAKN